MAEIDCSRVNELIREINQTDLEIADTLREMERLGFGTAKTLRLMRKVYAFAVKLDALVPGIWGALYEFVRCNDAKLAELTVAQMKQLLEVLQAHAELLIESLDTADPNETPEQKTAREQHLKEARDWLRAINAELANWLDTRGKEATIAALVALKRAVKAAAPYIIDALIDTFGDDILVAIANNFVSRKALIKKLAQSVVKFALGKAASQVANPFIGVALTGWELLVEVAGGQQVADLQAYVDGLLVQLVLLLARCGYGWVQTNDPKKGPPGFFVPNNEKFNGATVTAKAFVRCAKIVDGKPQWQPPCPVRIDNGRPAGTASISVALGRDNRDPRTGRWNITAALVPQTVANAPCLKDAKYCYTYFEITFTFPDGSKTTMLLIVGVKSF
jgi:hypothetical protein